MHRRPVRPGELRRLRLDLRRERDLVPRDLRRPGVLAAALRRLPRRLRVRVRLPLQRRGLHRDPLRRRQLRRLRQRLSRPRNMHRRQLPLSALSARPSTVSSVRREVPSDAPGATRRQLLDQASTRGGRGGAMALAPPPWTEGARRGTRARRRYHRPMCRAALGIAVVLVAGCEGGGYRIVVRIPTRSKIARATRLSAASRATAVPAVNQACTRSRLPATTAACGSPRSGSAGRRSCRRPRGSRSGSSPGARRRSSSRSPGRGRFRSPCGS